MIERAPLIFLLLTAAASAAPSAEAQKPTAPRYSITRTVSLGAPDRWDYVVYDGNAHRVYVAHGDRVTVVDEHDGKVIGSVEGFPGGTHGVAIATFAGKGYTDDGRAGTVASFDLKTLKTERTIKAEEDADGMVLDPFSRHLFVINGDSGKITVIDPRRDAVVATIDGGGGLEIGVADGKGKFFVDGADKGEIVVIDTETNGVTAHWPMPGCTKPHGLAMDVATERLFASCANKVLTVVNATNGALVATLPIGERNDGAAFDATRKLVFASNGDGTISVIREVNADKFVALDPIKTAVTGRTMTIAPASGRLFVAAADVDQNAPLAANGRPQIVAGSLKLLFIDPATITMEQAQAIALEVRPGKITKQELEHEAGGSGLRYSFDISSKGMAYEVGVDANTADILENQAEGKKPD